MFRSIVSVLSLMVKAFFLFLEKRKASFSFIYGSIQQQTINYIIFYKQKSSMGQQLKKVEEAVISLESKQLISSSQAQTFLNDYHSQVDIIQDINIFIEKPSLYLFLKHYINQKYQKKNHPSDVRRESKDIYKQEIDEMIIKEIQNKIIHHYEVFEEQTSKAIDEINRLMITRKNFEIKLLLDKILRNLLCFEKFQFTCRHRQQLIQHYSSEIDFLQFIQSQEENATLDSITQNSIQILVDKDFSKKMMVKVQILHWRMVLKVKCNHFLEKIFSKNRPKIENMIYEIVQYIVMETLDEGILAIDSQKIKIFSSEYLKILELFFYMKEEYLKEEIAQLANIQITQNSTIQTIMMQYFQENAENIRCSNSKKKNLFDDLFKYQTKIQKQFENFQLYRTKISTHDLFLDFDRFGQLKFISSNVEHNIIIKLEEMWGKQAIKIFNLFTEYHSLLANVKQATKAGFKPGIVEGEHEEFLCRLYINNNSILERIHIEIEEVCRKDNINQMDSQDEEDFSEIDSEQENQGISFKNLEKQHPRIGQEGWIDLFRKGKEKHKTCKTKSQLRIKTQKILLFPINDLDQSNLDILNFDQEKLNILIRQIMNSNPIFIDAINREQNKEKFIKFLAEVKYYYDLHGNEFHNFYHGINVMHMCYIFLGCEKNEEYLGEQECLSIILSGLCHDVGHTGFTNSFQIATFSKKALTYNDASPLQNFHASKTIQILSKSQNNFLSHLDRSVLSSIKKNIIHNILATDAKQHFNILGRFKEWKGLQKSKALEEIQGLTGMIVHTSDLCGTVKDYEVSKIWSQKINAQFMKQYKQEERLGLERSQSMKNLHIPKVWYQNESGFLKVIVIPLYKEMKEFYKEEAVQEMVDKVEQNLAIWENKLKEELMN